MDHYPLKPCPFCGGEVTLDFDKYTHIVPVLCPEGSSCMETGMGTYFDNRQLDTAIQAWNTRDKVR